MSDLQPREPVQRYEHESPGDSLHIDIKKLGRIARTTYAEDVAPVEPANAGIA